MPVYILEWMFFWAAEKLVESTGTQHDDRWFKVLKQGYFNAKSHEHRKLP
jgi:hypothetical protein